MNIMISWLFFNIIEIMCGFIDDYHMVFKLNFVFEVSDEDMVLILNWIS